MSTEPQSDAPPAACLNCDALDPRAIRELCRRCYNRFYTVWWTAKRRRRRAAARVRREREAIAVLGARHATRLARLADERDAWRLDRAQPPVPSALRA